MEFALLSQRDSRWSAIELGFNSGATDTIGWEGCAITCAAVAAAITPDVLNAALMSARGYFDGGFLIFGLLAAAVRSIPGSRSIMFVGMSHQYTYTPFDAAELARVFSVLRGEIPKQHCVMLEVNFTPGAPFRSHFALATGLAESGLIMIHDPWTLPAQQALAPLTPRYGPDNAYAIVRAIYLEHEI